MVVIAIGATFCGYFPLSVALVHFFKRQRGRALSLMSLGIAAGGVAMPLLGWCIENFGWRHTALGSGVVVLLLGWPLACAIRGNPAEVGSTIDGDPVAQPPAGAVSRRPEKDEFTVTQALRTAAFWWLGVGHALALLVVVAVNVHAISHMKEGLGYSLREATMFITLMTLGQGGGMLLGALVSERWSKRHVVAGCMLAHMVGLLMLTFAIHPAMLFAFAVLHGGAWGLRSPYMQALRADYFGLRAIGMILGLSAVFVALGQAAGPMIAGVLADMTGSYRTGFVVLALLAGSGSVMFLLARKPVLNADQ
jgi:sugar phosphate permease